MSSATVSLMGPATFLAVTKNITLDANILCNDDARQVGRKIAQCNSRVRLVAAMGFICQLDLRFGLWLFSKVILYHFIEFGLEIDSIGETLIFKCPVSFSGNCVASSFRIVKDTLIA